MGGVVAGIGPASVVFVAGASIVAQVAGWLQINVYGAWSSRTIVFALLGLAVLAGRHRSTQDVPRWWAVPLLGSAVLIGVYALVDTAGEHTGWLFAGDHLRHLVLVADEWHRGSLDYGAVAYPRGWHAAVALLWGAAGAEVSADGFVSLVRILSSAIWFVSIALSAALGLIALRVSRFRLLNPVLSGLAALLTTALLWWTPLMGSVLALGFETLLVAALSLAVAVAAAAHVPSFHSAALVLAAFVVVAHSWQLLLPPVVVLAFLVLTRLAAGISRERLGVLILAATGALAVSAPPLLAIVSEYGLAAAAAPGDSRPLPLVVILGTAALAAFCAWRSRRSRELTEQFLALTVLALVAWGFILAGLVQVQPQSYYPLKIHWTAVVLAMPLVSMNVVRALSLLDGSTGVRRLLLVPTGAAVALAAGIGLAGPWFAFTGRWSTANPVVVMAIVTTEGAERAQAVWTTAGAIDDRTAAALLEFYAVAEKDGIPPFELRTLDSQCRDLSLTRDPVVLSDRSVSEVQLRYACVPNVGVAAVWLPSGP